MKRNLSDYPEFNTAVQNDDLVFLFGTGISSSLTGKPYSWWKWIADGIDGLKDKSIAYRLKAELDNDSTTANMVFIAGKLITAAKADGSYNNWMHEAFEVNAITDNSLSKTLKKLILSQVVFATTNYDLLLENATGLEPLSYDDPDVAFRMLDKHLSTHILHIHGIFDSVKGVDNIIADDSQYTSVMENQGAQFIQHILGTRTLVFVGCGGTTEDPNISRFIEFANTHLKMDRTYFFLCKDSVNGLPDHIKPIQYGDEYSDLPTFLEELALTRLKKKISDHAVVGHTAYDEISVTDDSLLRYHFSQRGIPFCGRDTELDVLKGFIGTDNVFSWWAVTGQAGSGKSRLALELLHELELSWFGFFLNDGSDRTEIENFRPFCNTLVIIDYVAGRERAVADTITAFRKVFAPSDHKLRILLLERENNRTTGSWYSKLLNRMDIVDAEDVKRNEYKSNFLNLIDMQRPDVELFISTVCKAKGVEEDYKAELYEAYEKKFERLRFRPLYLQLFVEAWIDNGCLTPQYESYIELLEYVLNREQKRWIEVADNDQTVCNAFIRLMVRANIANLSLNDLPEIYRDDWQTISSFLSSHSFIGKQRRDTQDSLINYFCHNIDNEHAIIAPQFPDIIKEFMFEYYLDSDSLPEVMKEIWQHAASAFSVFIKKCKMDFPEQEFFNKAINAYQISVTDYDVLLGRLEMLRPRLIQKGEDPRAYWDVIDNEHEFWSSVQVPEGDSDENATIALFKIRGLYLVAQHIGAWSLYDMSEMEEVIDEMLAVKGGTVAELIKKVYMQEHLNALSQKGFLSEAKMVREKLDLLTDDNNEYDSLIRMQNYNNEMMDALLSGDAREARRLFQEMADKCRYDQISSVRMLAHSCFNIDHFSMIVLQEDLIGVGYPVVLKCEALYPDDIEIRSRRIGCRVAVLQRERMDEMITDDDLREEAIKLEGQLSTMNFSGGEADEALEGVWGSVKCLKLNVATQDEIQGIIDDAGLILQRYPNFTSVAQTRIAATRALHEEYLHTKTTHSEVEELYKHLELNPESEGIRTEFFEMLSKSEDAGRERDFYNEDIIREAISDARYNPIYGSGIPEIDDIFYDDIWADEPYIRKHPKIGRNDPCPCGSGKKFKNCCLGKGIYD